jgi:hypothetical protein
MTQPVLSGFPDWGRFQARATKVYVAGTPSLGTSLTNVGTFFVGDVPYVSFNAEGDGVNTWLFAVEFHDQPSGGNLVTTFFVAGRMLAFGSMSIPVIGPWMRIRGRSNPAPGTPFLLACGSWVKGSQNRHTGDSGMIFEIATSLGAGASANNDLNGVWPGGASVSLQAPSGPARMILHGINFDGTFTPFFRMATTGGNENTTTGFVYLPSRSPRVQRINDHSSSQAVRATVSVHPMGFG